MTTTKAAEDVLVDRPTGLHATLTWEPWRNGFRRSDGAGYVMPQDDGRWWVTWSHPMGGGPGWHHHAFGSYVDATFGAMAFDKVYDLERIAGNTDRCPEARAALTREGG